MMPPTDRLVSTVKNLFLYRVWLEPEAYFIVCRHEKVYSALLSLWLKAYKAMPPEILTYGVMPSPQKMEIMLLCEAPADYPGRWCRMQCLGDLIDGYCSPDSTAAEEMMPGLSAFIKTRPHQRYIEWGSFFDMLDNTEDIARLIEPDFKSMVAVPQ